MAKKNSSKTATQEAIKASEPKLQTFTGWQGVNFKDAPLGWDPGERYDSSGKWPDGKGVIYDGHNYSHHQSDLKSNYLLIQNNVVTEGPTLETRPDAEVIFELPDSLKNPPEPQEPWNLTGVSCLFHRWLFLVISQELPNSDDDPIKAQYRIIYHDITDTNVSSYTMLALYDADLEQYNPQRYRITEINYYQEQLIVLTYHKEDPPTGRDPEDPDYNKYVSEIFTADLFYLNNPERLGHDAIWVGEAAYDDDGIWDKAGSIPFKVKSPRYVPDPTTTPILRAIGQASSKEPSPYKYKGEKNSYEDLPAPSDTQEGDTWLVHEAHGTEPAETYYYWKNLRWVAIGKNLTIMTTRVQIYFAYVNKFGSTLPSNGSTIYTETNPVTWSSAKYLEITGTAPTDKEITGVDIYCTLDENSDAIFIGHVDLEYKIQRNGSWVYPNGGAWIYNWLGAMSDISQWTNAQLIKPTENNTKGVTARYFSIHDSRLYFWGDPEHPYRLWIGGNPGAELSVARGLGGAFVDIEPGSGIEIHGTEKWKTTAGANIITMLCGNPNTNRVKRFNLVETSITVTNEISSKGYMYEEVSNVVGCNSRWGHGVFADGLYTVSRYGLMLTTMAMEYNSQMRNTDVSDVISPIFEERLGERLNDARLVHINGIIYIILSETKVHPDKPQTLDLIILCYDIDAKAWYTFTHGHEGSDDGLLLHAMAIDSEEHEEGLGIISENAVTLYPTTGIQDTTSPKFIALIETGELAARTPIQGFYYLCQLELRFDYFIGEADVLIEGVDYYGRDFKVIKHLNRFKYGRNPDGSYGPDNAEMRSHVEWIRVDKHVESYRIQIKGKARFRLTHINAKVYQDSARIGLPYGFDAGDGFVNRHSKPEVIHHYIKDYNNLRRAIVT